MVKHLTGGHRKIISTIHAQIYIYFKRQHRNVILYDFFFKIRRKKNNVRVLIE